MRKNRVSPLKDPKTEDKTQDKGFSTAGTATGASSLSKPKTAAVAVEQKSSLPTELGPVFGDFTAGSQDKEEAQQQSAGRTLSEPTSQGPVTSPRRWSAQFQKEMMDYEAVEEEWPRLYPRSYRRLSLRKFQRSYSVEDEPRPHEGPKAKQSECRGQTWKVDLKMVSDRRPSLADQPAVMDEEWPRISSRFYSTVSPEVQREYLACLLKEEVEKAATVIAGASQWKALDLEDVKLAFDLLGRAHQAKRESVASHPTSPQAGTGAASPPTLSPSAPALGQAEAGTGVSIAMTRAVPVVLPHALTSFRLSDPMMRVYQSDKQNVYKLEPMFLVDYEGSIPEARKCSEQLEQNNNMATGTDIRGMGNQDQPETDNSNKLISAFNLKSTDLEALPCLLVHRHGQRVIIQKWKVLINVDKELIFYREIYLRKAKEGRQNSVTKDLESKKNVMERQEMRTKMSSEEGTASNNSETKISTRVLQTMLSEDIIEDLKRLYTVFVTWFPEKLEGGWLASLFLEASLVMVGDVAKFSCLARHVMDTLQELRVTDVLILTPLLMAALQKNVEQFYDVYSQNPDVLECCCGFPYLRTSALAAIGLGWGSFLEDLKNFKDLKTGDLISWRNFKSLSRITFLMLFDAGQTEQLIPYLRDTSRDDLRVDNPEQASKATQAELQVAEGLCSAWLCCVRKASLMERGLWASRLPVLEAWLGRVSRQQPWVDHVHGLRHVRGRDVFKMAHYLRTGQVACPKLRVFILLFYGPEREELRCALTELSTLMSAEEPGKGSESFNRFTTFLLGLALNFQLRDTFVELLTFAKPKLLSLHKSDLYYIPALGFPSGRSALRKIIGAAPPGTFTSWEMLLLLGRGDLTALHAMLSGQAGRSDVHLDQEFLLDVLQHGQLEEFMDLAQAILELPCGPQLLAAPQGYDFLLRAASRAPPRLFFQLYEGKVKGKLEQDKCDRLLDMMMRNGPPVDLIY